MMYVLPESEFVCTACGLQKSSTAFYRNKRRASGFMHVCKACFDSRRKASRAKDVEGARAKAREVAKRSYRKNREKILEKQAARWRDEPEKMREVHARSRAKRNSERQSVLRQYDLTPQLFQELLRVQEERCGRCGVSMRYVDSTEFDAVVDHVGPKGPDCAVRGLLHHSCNGALSRRRVKLTVEETHYCAEPPALKVPELALRFAAETSKEK